MNAATNRLAGRSYRSRGVSHCSIRPPLSTATRDPHRHRLDLVVGDVDGRGAELALEPGDLGAHLHAQLGVEVGQRLVHQERRRLAHDGPAHGDALALAARQLRRACGRAPLSSCSSRAASSTRAGRSRAAGSLASLQRVGDVLAHGHVRVERVALEHHGDVAVLGRGVGDVAPPMTSSPAVTSSRPAIIRSRVDLPQPDGPTSTRSSPSATSRSTSSTATTPVRVLLGQARGC